LAFGGSATTELAVLLAEAARRAAVLTTAEAPLAPAQSSTPPEARQIDEHHLIAILHLGHDATRGTAHGTAVQLDHDFDRLARLVDQAQDIHVR
jgi:hypothetical protein